MLSIVIITCVRTSIRLAPAALRAEVTRPTSAGAARCEELLVTELEDALLLAPVASVALAQRHA
jgi:hypothetical protein